VLHVEKTRGLTPAIAMRLAHKKIADQANVQCLLWHRKKETQEMSFKIN